MADKDKTIQVPLTTVNNMVDRVHQLEEIEKDNKVLSEENAGQNPVQSLQQ